MTEQDMVVTELASAMEVVSIPDDDEEEAAAAQAQAAQQQQHQNGNMLHNHSHNHRLETIDMSDMKNEVVDVSMQTAFNTTNNNSNVGATSSEYQNQNQNHRPYDDLGPACNPLAFPRPHFERGRRDKVLCYFPGKDQHQVLQNVLFRDYSLYYHVDADHRVTQAYWPLPHKKPIKTIMGHVEVCLVLERCLQAKKEEDDNEDDDDDDESSVNDDDEEDIVFQVTNERVAVKVNYGDRMEQLRNKHAEDPLQEISALQLIGTTSEHVLGCRDVLFDGRNVNVVMRYCDSGDLFELLHNSSTNLLDDDTADQQQASCSPGMSEPQARYWFRQLVQGLQHLHSVGICHRDLSPENVMIDDEEQCLIIDMGMCLRVPYLDSSEQNITDVTQGTKRCLFKPQGACGKLPYMSPEIFKSRDNFDGEAADIFTAGTILFCMLTGNRSYQQPHISDPQFYWMTHGLEQLLADWQVNLSPEGLHLLQNMLQVDPRLRLTLPEVMEHPWFSYPDDVNG